MPDLKISQLSAGGAAQAADEFPIARSGGNAKITGANIAAAATSVGTLSSLTVSGNIGIRSVASPGITKAASIEGSSDTVGSGNAQLVVTSTTAAAADAGGILAFQANTTPASNFPVASIAGRHQTLAASNYSGYLQFNTTSAGGGVAERMRLDASGNLGLGVTPSAWGSGWRVVELEYGASGQAFAALYPVIAANTYNNGTNYLYKNTAAASYYAQVLGQHRWFTAPSGTAGNAITFTQAMTLDANGNLGVGTTSPAVPIHAQSNSANSYQMRVSNNSATADANRAAIQFANDAGVVGYIGTHGSNSGASLGTPFVGAINLISDQTNGINVTAANASGVVRFFTGATATANIRWTINSSGHFLAGTDNTYDIGASGATRPRDLFLGGNMVGGGWVRAGAASAGAASTTTIGSTTATTVGAAGAASALPANPLGYIVAHVGTTEVRIPYYNA